MILTRLVPCQKIYDFQPIKSHKYYRLLASWHPSKTNICGVRRLNLVKRRTSRQVNCFERCVVCRGLKMLGAKKYKWKRLNCLRIDRPSWGMQKLKKWLIGCSDSLFKKRHSLLFWPKSRKNYRQEASENLLMNGQSQWHPINMGIFFMLIVMFSDRGWKEPGKPKSILRHKSSTNFLSPPSSITAFALLPETDQLT